MRLQNLLTFNAKTFALDLFDFLQSYLGSKLMAWVTIGVIGLLSIAFLICTFLAILKPIKRKRKKLKKALTRQQEFDNLRNRLIVVEDELATTNLEIRIIKKQLQDDVYNLTEIADIAHDQDVLYIDSKKQEIEDLKERQTVLLKALVQAKKGTLKNMQKDKVESAKLLLSELKSQQQACQNEINWKSVSIEKRAIQLDLDIQSLKDACDAKIRSLNAKLRSYENEKAHLETKVSRMAKKGRHKLTVMDAKVMIDEYSKSVKQLEKEREELALQELQKAKEEYETAKSIRIAAEKNMALAVENVKSARKEKSKKKEKLKKRDKKALKLAQKTAASENTEDVKIIVADIENSTTETPIEEKPVTNNEPAILEAEEHVYEEPTVEVVDINNIPEEEVVFIEAFLDLNTEAEDSTEEAAVTDATEDAEPSEPVEEASTADANEENTQEEILAQQAPVSDAEPTEEFEPANDLQEISLITSDEPEITLTPAISNEEHTDSNDDKSYAKIYDSYIKYTQHYAGIPATPVYMKNKFQKPVTKLIKKEKSSLVSSEPIAETNTQTVKIGYNGKWKIEEVDGKYLAKLFASNGGLLLSTSTYISPNGAKDCIEKIKDSLENDRTTILTDKEGKHFFKVLSTSDRTIVQSAKYGSKYQCEKALASAKKFAQTAIIL